VSKIAGADVVARLEKMDPGRVVVTGGEPLLQQRALVPLLEACAQRGWPVEVETNGTIAPEPAVAELVEQFNVSPKTTNSGVAEDKRLKPDALKALLGTGKAVFKFVVVDEADLDEIADLVEAHDLRPTWVMPEGTDAGVITDRMRALAEPVLERGWHLTPRLHILLWGDERGR
jgi:organic radical activating enzyme